MAYLGHSSDGFGLHSLRAGGASAAAQAGIPDHLLSSMRGGAQKLPRMVILRTLRRTVCRCQRILVFNEFIVLLS